MSKNRVLLSVITVVAVVAMFSETASAQLFSGRLLSRMTQSKCCCAPAAEAASCDCKAPAPAPAPAPAACSCEAPPAPAPAPCCAAAAAAPVAVAAPAPVVAAPAPVVEAVAPVESSSVVVAAPIESAPIVSAPIVSAPIVSAPIVSAPVSPCCGGAISSPIVTASGLFNSSSTGDPLQDGLPPGAVIISSSVVGEDSVAGETILETGEVAQDSPSDSGTVTSDIVEPPAAPSDEAPAEDK